MDATKTTPLPLRNDTILGVCEAVGTDFGFNPNWLRLAFIAPLFFAPLASVGAYLLLGLIVAATRLLVKDGQAPQAAPELPVKMAAEESGATAEENLPIAA